MLIGYDTRFSSREFAASAAEVLTANRVTTYLCDRAAPTPAASFNLRGQGGRRRRRRHGQPQSRALERAQVSSCTTEAARPRRSSRSWRYTSRPRSPEGPPARLRLDVAESRGLLEYLDPEPAYLSHLATFVDLGAIRRAGLKVIVDPMHGSGAGYFDKLLSGEATSVVEIRSEPNPAFPGMSQPEPVARNLGTLRSSVRRRHADLGLATDGDADRLGLVDERGGFVTTLQAFALLCLHQLDVLGRRGPLVRSITMTSMVDKLGDEYGVPVFDTPVGFKYLGPVMMKEDALPGRGRRAAATRSGATYLSATESSSGLMVLDLMVKTGKTVSELLRMLADKVGPHHYDRLDLAFEPKQRRVYRGQGPRGAAVRPRRAGRSSRWTPGTASGSCSKTGTGRSCGSPAPSRCCGYTPRVRHRKRSPSCWKRPACSPGSDGDEGLRLT